MLRVFLVIGVLWSTVSPSHSQELKWLDFEELEKAYTSKPRKVLISFYADWCVYCKKMDQAVYKDPSVIKALDKDYYAVKFNAESRDTIRFGGKIFTNRNIGKKRWAFHEIPEYLAGRQHRDLELPATVILNADFSVAHRYYRYISPKEMLSILTDD